MDNEYKDNLEETVKIEKAAQELVLTDRGRANRPATATKVATPRRNEKRDRHQLYGDKSVPRIRPQRRYIGSSHSRAYLRKPLELYSDTAQIFFERNYERVNQSLIVSTLVTEAIGGVDLANQISDLIQEEFSKLTNSMMNAIKSLENGVTEKGIEEDLQVPAYDHVRHYEPPLHTPHSAQFLTICQLYDLIVSRIEGAWINHVITPKQRKEAMMVWAKHVNKLVNRLHEIRTKALTQARHHGYGSRAAAIETEARQVHVENNLGKTDLPTTRATNKPKNPQKTSLPKNAQS